QSGRPGRDPPPRCRVPRLLVRRHRRPPRGEEHQSLRSRVRPALRRRIWGEAAARNPRLRPPLPPPEKKVQFKFEDEVEAFYSDGWWEGAIIAEHSSGKFAVFLRGFDEQIVFEEKDLRLPVQWVKGKWEPRFEQVQREKENSNFSKEVMKFTQGMQVEVLTDEDGLKGAWFAATIIEPSGEDKYLIEYKTLRNDDDTEFLREVILACNIRPCPPEIIVVDGFKVWDAVDAYY
ncbi:unnamed protein product, partial [Linum tenue]